METIRFLAFWGAFFAVLNLAFWLRARRKSKIIIVQDDYANRPRGSGTWCS